MKKLSLCLQLLLIQLMTLNHFQAQNLQNLQRLNNQTEALISLIRNGQWSNAYLMNIKSYGNQVIPILSRTSSSHYEYERTYKFLGIYGELLVDSAKNNTEAIEFLLPVTRLSRFHINKGMGRCFYWLGKSYLILNHNKEAVRYFEDAEHILKQYNDPLLHKLYNSDYHV